MFDVEKLQMFPEQGWFIPPSTQNIKFKKQSRHFASFFLLLLWFLNSLNLRLNIWIAADFELENS